ncbi:hypothetical protein NPIL_36651 [Nephila pilipes]|uniref:Uncharacterized protein n=1 Tax=Nephila pilipes TaxID=299642 RepID=A0A8X6N5N7_NEPPI|nr:hypothetical protein NPIL_36651 [Nephila pilipes]
MDTRLIWNKQACKLKDIGSARNRLLKKLTGVKWSTIQDLLCTTYKSYIRPAIEYCSELITTSEAVQDGMENTQNNPLRVVTGGVFSIPILAMQKQTRIEPLSHRRKIGALKLVERLKRRRNFWRTYSPAVHRLKSQPIDKKTGNSRPIYRF